ncbi:Hypothetical protein R9X50_00305200 [Acrodontium crateriforme]|uniref:serine--tRNA ligase n=1 Tax=Acrodontium crateriforme TaxID=150365 RepID=A0AAQ3M244_9PEZI|nr:Hypothetical protein R9X50_00305200 [Acrodontium crateriforme]
MLPRPFVCASCRSALRRSNGDFTKIITRSFIRPAFAPKPILDLKHMRQNPGLYEQNAIDRNYAPYAKNGWKILELHEDLTRRRRDVVALRQRNNEIAAEMKSGHKKDGTTALIEEARILKSKLSESDRMEKGIAEEMERLALELPNLSSLHTPVGETPEVLEYLNGDTPPVSHSGKSHVDIGRELDLLDFDASSTTSGWGWYFLKNEGALLEMALVHYALSVAMKRGWQVMTPPSLVYGHMASACGFMPRDANGETQIYNIAHEDGKAGLVLAGTAEIPFAGSQAGKTLNARDLPIRVIGSSRCYRAEAGARGVDTKGLYRVHEFTKVEMFAWTAPPTKAQDSDRFDNDDVEDDKLSESNHDETMFDEMVGIQKEMLTSLGLHARVLEMPSTDMGASAQRKIDIEAFFPSRTSIDNGYGEVTSASQCGDYQARRLATKVKNEAGKLDYAHTLNGTAIAVPRVLAALLENGWDESKKVVVVPECLRRWMPGESATIGPKPSRE